MKQEVRLKVNGIDYSVFVKPQTSLLDLLREDLGLTGTKKGCNNGDCGSCVVLLNGEPVNSCLILAVEAEDAEITTIEGLAKGGSLHPVQEAFVKVGAVQCGYCTPGMVLSAKALLEKKVDPTEAEIKEAIKGHLCRCTGYIKIVEAVEEASKTLKSTNF